MNVKTKPATIKVGEGDSAYTVEGEQIELIGVPPFRIANTHVVLTFKNLTLTNAIVLDLNGYPVARTVINNGRIELPSSAVSDLLQ